MNERDHQPIVTIAFLAALADGRTTPDEDQELRAALGRLGIKDVDAVAQRGAGDPAALIQLAGRLSDEAARRLAYETALVVCHSDGSLNQQETDFLNTLRNALGLSASTTADMERSAAALAAAQAAAPTTRVEVGTGKPPSDEALDQQILQQAMITGAVELLPDRLANVVILPLQLRLVYQIGQHHGQRLDAGQVKDLAATLGLGAAAQAIEGVVRKLLGGVVGGAASVAVTFAATYALGHVAKQYYAQGRRLGRDDLRRLFGQFQEEAKTIFPKVKDEIQTRAKTLKLDTFWTSRP
jgi:uncharacterized protein (DUF697 family)/tellurite resistance protein